jgi:hypothetical protein
VDGCVLFLEIHFDQFLGVVPGATHRRSP